MAKVKELHSEMARARHNDGISVIFDQKSPVSSRSRSRSGSSRSSSSIRSSDPERHRGRRSHRGRYRSRSSSTSSSRSRSSSHARSRSHPRCYRPSSRCRCDGHYRSGRGRDRRSPRRSCKASSHSLSRSPSSDRYSQRHRRHRSRSRSSSRQNRHRRTERRFRGRPSRSPSRSRSQSKSSGRSVSLSMDDKRELLNAAKANAMKILGTEKLDLPESVKPILPEEPEVTPVSPQPETWVRQDPEKTPSQSSEEELDDLTIPRISPKRKIISFSINNSVVKPAVVAPSTAKVTARVDIYESRKPYGHWVPVKSGQRAKTHKHTHAMSH